MKGELRCIQYSTSLAIYPDSPVFIEHVIGHLGAGDYVLVLETMTIDGDENSPRAHVISRLGIGWIWLSSAISVSPLS